MIEGHHPLLQTLLGTLLTWGFTAAGAAVVFVFRSVQREVLDGSLGFAAGVMLAASFWSLLEPALELAATSGDYGIDGQWAFVPVGIGFLLGALFVFGADYLLPDMDVPSVLLRSYSESSNEDDGADVPRVTVASGCGAAEDPLNVTGDSVRRRATLRRESGKLVQPKPGGVSSDANSSDRDDGHHHAAANWKRIVLLIVAITVHNIPEGLAVGVGFGASGKSSSSGFQNARNLAIGIGIQNFPEGLSVSLPLRGAGFSTWRSFWYGQLSGMVEPVAGLFGAFAVAAAQPILPYALAFAAGAMVYVVVDDIIPEAQRCGNGRLASGCSVLGFLVMMALDVGLG